MANEERFVSGALKAWDAYIEQADGLFSNLTEQQLGREVAPGKNRLIYLWGHLIAVHDGMLPLLYFGQHLHFQRGQGCACSTSSRKFEAGVE